MGNWGWTSCTLPMPRSSSPCSSLLLQQPHLGGEGELGVAEGSGQGHGGSLGTAVGRVRSLEGGPAPAKGCVLEEEERSAFLSCESPGALGLVLGQTDSSLLNHRFLGPIAGGPESTGICRAWESAFKHTLWRTDSELNLLIWFQTFLGAQRRFYSPTPSRQVGNVRVGSGISAGRELTSPPQEALSYLALPSTTPPVGSPWRGPRVYPALQSIQIPFPKGLKHPHSLQFRGETFLWMLSGWSTRPR